jgi:hypothetical protein
MFPVDLPIWLNHFEHHAEHPRSIPPDIGDDLSFEEKKAIARSIATFQLGEQAEGRTLLRAARHFAQAKQLPAVARIVELFIREEQRHAALLRAYMEDHGIALKRRDWTDGIFRRLRRLAGLEFYLYIFISAELVGNVYYRALERATRCERLKVLCRVLVSEELAHVGFESEVLLALRARRSPLAQSLMRCAHRAFFAATTAVVWLTHRPVLRRAGYDARGFLAACLEQHAFYLGETAAAARPQRAGFG